VARASAAAASHVHHTRDTTRIDLNSSSFIFIIVIVTLDSVDTCWPFSDYAYGPPSVQPNQRRRYRLAKTNCTRVPTPTILRSLDDSGNAAIEPESPLQPPLPPLRLLLMCRIMYGSSWVQSASSCRRRTPESRRIWPLTSRKGKKNGAEGSGMERVGSDGSKYPIFLPPSSTPPLLLTFSHLLPISPSHDVVISCRGPSLAVVT